jgi:hypothetical protein
METNTPIKVDDNSFSKKRINLFISSHADGGVCMGAPLIHLFFPVHNHKLNGVNIMIIEKSYPWWLDSLSICLPASLTSVYFMGENIRSNNFYIDDVAPLKSSLL